MSETNTPQTVQTLPTQAPATTETDAAQQERPYAILRIKRKRNEEPLDGLRTCTICYPANVI